MTKTNKQIFKSKRVTDGYPLFKAEFEIVGATLRGRPKRYSTDHKLRISN